MSLLVTGLSPAIALLPFMTSIADRSVDTSDLSKLVNPKHISGGTGDTVFAGDGPMLMTCLSQASMVFVADCRF